VVRPRAYERPPDAAHADQETDDASGQTSRRQSPGPTGFGFGSGQRPTAAAPMMKSSGPHPKTNNRDHLHETRLQTFSYQASSGCAGLTPRLTCAGSCTGNTYPKTDPRSPASVMQRLILIEEAWRCWGLCATASPPPQVHVRIPALKNGAQLPFSVSTRVGNNTCAPALDHCICCFFRIVCSPLRSPSIRQILSRSARRSIALTVIGIKGRLLTIYVRNADTP